MGTNYYCIDTTGNRGKIHIGKISHGWVFLYHIYPGFEDSTPEDFAMLANAPGSHFIIEDEYGERCDPDEWLEMLKNRRGQPRELPMTLDSKMNIVAYPGGWPAFFANNNCFLDEKNALYRRNESQWATPGPEGSYFDTSKLDFS